MIDIPEDLVIAHARNGSPNAEIAAILGCSEGVIRQRFSKALKKGRAERKALVRKLQLESAKKLNPALLIWLGKNELGQVDAPKEAQPSAHALPTLKLVSITPSNAAAGKSVG